MLHSNWKQFLHEIILKTGIKEKHVCDEDNIVAQPQKAAWTATSTRINQSHCRWKNLGSADTVIQHISTFLKFALRCLLKFGFRLFLVFFSSQLATSVYYNVQNAPTSKIASLILQSCDITLALHNSAEGFQSFSGVFMNFSQWFQNSANCTDAFLSSVLT